MKTISVFTIAMISLLLFGSSAYAVKCLKGEGPSVVRNLDVQDFYGIALSLPADVRISPGASFEVTVEGQANIIDNLETDVYRGVWNIEFDECVRDYEELRFNITMPEINEIALSGSGDIYVEEGFPAVRELELAISGSGSLTATFQAQETELAISGSGDAKLNLVTQSLETAISGSGDLEISGAAEELEVSIAGSGNVDGEELVTKNTEVSIAGSGDCEIGVHEYLEVSIVGSGSVRYIGNPEVERSILGSGSVRQSK